MGADSSTRSGSGYYRLVLSGKSSFLRAANFPLRTRSDKAFLTRVPLGRISLFKAFLYWLCFHCPIISQGTGSIFQKAKNLHPFPLDLRFFCGGYFLPKTGSKCRIYFPGFAHIIVPQKTGQLGFLWHFFFTVALPPVPPTSPESIWAPAAFFNSLYLILLYPLDNIPCVPKSHLTLFL